MELKEYWRVIKRGRKLFLGIWLVTVLATFLVLALWPVSYKADLALNLAREGEIEAESSDKDFDQYYILQSNQMLGGNIVGWIKNEALKEKVATRLEKKELSKKQAELLRRTLKAEQLGPGFIQVQFKVKEKKQAQQAKEELEKIIKSKVDELKNKEQKEPWFKVVTVAFAVKKSEPFWLAGLVVSVVMGFWLALGGVMLKHYWQK